MDDNIKVGFDRSWFAYGQLPFGHNKRNMLLIISVSSVVDVLVNISAYNVLVNISKAVLPELVIPTGQ